MSFKGVVKDGEWEQRIARAAAMRNVSVVRYIQAACEKQILEDEEEMRRRSEADEEVAAQEHGRRMATALAYLRKRKERVS